MIKNKQIRKPILTAFTLASLVLLVTHNSNVSAQTVARFQDTEAAKAFVAEEYSRALEEFLKLRDNNPKNALILRYLAITLDQLGRYQEAIDIFKEALVIAPNNISLHYHLGVTYYNARLDNEAIASFGRILDQEQAQDSEYAELAATYLDALSQQISQQQRAGAPQRFGAYLQTAYQHDNNILAVSEDVDGPNSDNRLSGYLNLDYYLLSSPSWVATASINGYGSWYNDDTFSYLETPQYGGDLRVQRTGVVANYPFIGSLNYNYRKVDLADGDPYSRSHSATLGLRMNFTGNTASYGYYRYTDDDFNEEGFDEAFSSRDADNHALGVRQTWFFAERQGQFSVGLDYEKNNADGVNFQMDGLSGSINAQFPLPWAMQITADAIYGDDNYDQFAGPVDRETNRSSYTLGLSRWFGSALVQLDYNYTDENSTYDVLSYNRSIWGASLSYVY